MLPRILEMKDPADYDGSPVCPRCGSGWPGCADSDYTHDQTCAIYNWAGYTCGRCTLEMALKDGITVSTVSKRT